MTESKQKHSNEKLLYQPIISIWLARLKAITPEEIDYVFDPSNNTTRRIRTKAKKPDDPPKDSSPPNVVLAEKAPLFFNLNYLTRSLGLNPAEALVLAFCVLIKASQPLRRLSKHIECFSSSDAAYSLAHVLDLPPSAVIEAISPKSALRRCKLLEVTNYPRQQLDEFFDIPGQLSEILLRPHESFGDFLGEFCSQAEAPTLNASDYPHLKEELELSLEYLKKVCTAKHKGVNLLLYGPPGTGKTEFARLLAETLNKPLYQVKSGDDDEEVISTRARLASLVFTQRSVGNGANALILFDEIEDVFPAPSGFMGAPERVGKGWVTTLLETNPVPTIWISNEISQIDPAYLRRFHLTIEMPNPPRAVREKIAHKSLKGLQVDTGFYRKLSLIPDLSPAQMQLAAHVARVVGTKGTTAEDLCLKLIQSGLRAQGKSDRVPAAALQIDYQLQYLNTNLPVPNLIPHLKRTQKGLMALYGPPGTGKTMLGHYIAEELNMPLLIQRASDLISPYVGETEQKIAAMFRRAEAEGAVLLLDEADSFLRSRKTAAHSWEVTQVNEMLTAMESYEGVFICSTNLMDNVDEAALRRFALKIKFDYLLPEQSWGLFVEHVGRIPVNQKRALQQSLAGMSRLAPGDFATVKKQLALFGITRPKPEDFLNRLQHELQAKSPQSQRIGFIR